MSAYLMIIAMVMLSGCIWGWVLPNMMEISITGIIALTIWRRLISKNYFISQRNFIVLLCVLLVLVLNILLTDSSFADVYQIIAISIALWFFSEGISKEEFSQKYINVMVILGAMSVFFWVLSKFGVEIAPQTVSVENSAFYRLNAFYIYRSTGNELHINYLNSRNCGVFWEPGAYQGYLNLGLLFLLTGKEKLDKYDKIKALILVGTVLTTLSTTGYLVLLLNMGIFYLNVIKKQLKKSHIILFLVIVMVVGIVINLPVVQNKFDLGNISFSIRLNDNLSGIKAIFEEPIFGLGYSSERYYEVMKSYEIDSNSTGLLMVLQQFGVIAGTIILVHLFRNLNKLVKREKYAYLLLLAFFLLEMSTEAFITKAIYMVLLFSFNSNLVIPQIIKRKSILNQKNNRNY